MKKIIQKIRQLLINYQRERERKQDKKDLEKWMEDLQKRLNSDTYEIDECCKESFVKQGTQLPKIPWTADINHDCTCCLD